MAENDCIEGGSASPQTPSTTCRFQKEFYFDDPPRVWKCPHPPEHDGLCIHHLPKQSVLDRGHLSEAELDKTEQLAKRCLEDLTILIQKTERDDSASAHEFIGFEIPGRFGISQMQLTKPVNFHNARFYGDTTFFQCTLPAADFQKVEFLGSVNFYYVQFDNTAMFHDAVFHGATRFSSVEFLDQAFLCNTHFHDDCTFSGNFYGYTNFCGAQFESSAAFEGFGGEPVFHGMVLFENLSIATDARVSFTNLSLAKADFYDTDLEKIRFTNVAWNTMLGRDSLWGEVRLLKIDKDENARKEHGIDIRHSSPQIEKLASSYAQLVRNYEQRRDVDTAEAFHICEMEMRRRKIAIGIQNPKLRAVREHCNVFGLYKLSSIYGSSYARAAFVLISLVLLFAMLFLWSGIAPTAAVQSAGSSPAPDGLIRYQLLPDATHPLPAPKDWLMDYGRALIFTLSITTFQRNSYYSSASRATDLFAMLAFIIIGAQAALLLFAVRRRFKR
ncbi:MAG: pentapeptide repeat-containing protein [Pseudomonadota bacterium]